jgi:hypothetical protein
MGVWRLVTGIVTERVGYSSEQGSTLPASALARGERRENEVERLVGREPPPRETINGVGVDS